MTHGEANPDFGNGRINSNLVFAPITVRPSQLPTLD